MRPLLSLVIALFLASGCQRRQDPKEIPPEPEFKPRTFEWEHVHVRLDEESVKKAGDWFGVIEPVKSCAKIYDSFEDYEESLRRFSRAQRLFAAIDWYLMEVNNGGHDQFYSNSTGIVWKDALDGLQLIGANEVADILAESAKRMGGNPSFDRTVRQQQLERHNADFRDLDDRLFNTESKLDAKMLGYIRANPREFVFDGMVKRLKRED